MKRKGVLAFVAAGPTGVYREGIVEVRGAYSLVCSGSECLHSKSNPDNIIGPYPIPNITKILQELIVATKI